MKLFIVLLCIVSVISRTTWDKLNNYTFEDYVKEFKKSYPENEYQERRVVFQRRLSQIMAHNANPNHSWKQGVNHLTDLHDFELSKMMGYKRTSGIKPTSISRATNKLKTFPRTVDWRTSGIITPVKDQGHCGSCWAFASAESIESYWALQKGYLVTLSEQQIVDCVANPRHCGGTGGCNGGTAELAFETLKSTGIASEWTYPYVSHSGSGSFKCHFDATSTPAEANVTGFVKLEGNSYHNVMEALILQGPLAINVDASTWHSYESGVFDGCNQTNPDVNHVVQLVGYGTDEVHGDYWLIRNSWRPTYGEGGYIRVRRTSNEDARCGTDLTPQDGVACDGDPPTARVCGTCGVIYDVSYPLVN